MPARKTPNIPQNELINLVLAYLQGTRISEIRQKLHETCHVAQHDAGTLYQSITITPPLQERLFKLLCVPQKAQHLYLNEKKLLTLLVRLHQDGYGYQHLAFLLTLIQKTKYTYGWKKRIAASLIATLGLSLWGYFNRERLTAIQQFLMSSLPQIILRGLKKTTLLLRNIPLVGMGYTFLSLLWNAYTIFYHGFSNLSHKLTLLLFKLLSKGFVLSAYAVCFFAAGVATPLTGFFFVAGAAIDIIESLTLFLLIKLKPVPEHRPKTWEEQADYARQDNQRRHATSTIWISASAAILTTLVMAIWCFFPPSIFLTLGCIAATIVLGLIKSVILEHINTVYATSLQTALRSIPIASDDETITVKQTYNPYAGLNLAPKADPCKAYAHLAKQQTTFTSEVTTLGRSFATFFSNTPSSSANSSSEDTVEHHTTYSIMV